MDEELRDSPGPAPNGDSSTSSHLRSRNHDLGREESETTPLEAKVDALIRTIRDLVAQSSQPVPRESSDRYTELAAAADDFIFVVDLSGQIDYINPAAAELLNVKADRMVGQPFERLGLLPEPLEAEEMLARVIVDEEIVRYERVLHQASGSKYFYTTLSPMRDALGVMTGVLGIAKDVSELARTRDELRSLSLVDELTAVYNRRGFVSLASQQLSLAQRNGSRVCLVMADMDGLKDINDRFGHHEGDAALARLATMLKDNCRQSDIVARIGGDEFVLLAPGISEGGSDFLVARLQRAVKAENRRVSKPYRFAASIGAVESRPDPSYTVDRLLEEADRKMYEVKRARAS